jgi:hypothetical protein
MLSNSTVRYRVSNDLNTARVIETPVHWLAGRTAFAHRSWKKPVTLDGYGGSPADRI